MKNWVVCASCEKLNRVEVERAREAAPVCGSCKAALPLRNGVQEVSGTGLNKLIRSADIPTVVDFWAEWCGPCKAFAPTFQAVAQEWAGKFVFAKLDTEAHSLAAQAYQIRGIPTLIVFKGGVEVDRTSGALPPQELKRYLSQWV